jgi:hypothetical protein
MARKTSIRSSLIVESGSSLHSKEYISAIKEALSSFGSVYLHQSKARRFPLLLESINKARKLSCDIIIFVTFEKVVGLYLLSSFLIQPLINSRIFAFYFNYHNLLKITPKSFIIALAILLSPFTRIFISDPFFGSTLLHKLLSKRLAYLPDFYDPQKLSASADIDKANFFRISTIRRF